ncbi:MAG: hypothetical protein RBG13Loki_3997 [Promethearchaeota archaeon CR_4]|nr:MAG: hypothetical protein RBG13Loki_3997 [Candidatus Lokiarchaeota archaeon CR_4]
MTGDIIGDYEKLLERKWKERSSARISDAEIPSNTESSNVLQIKNLSGLTNIAQELGAQLFDSNENHVTIITKNGKYQAAFLHLQTSNEGETRITHENFQEFQDKNVEEISPDKILTHLSEYIYKTYKVKPNFIRIIDVELLQLFVEFYSKHNGNQTLNVTLSFLAELFARWMTGLIAGNWIQYPELPLVTFLRNIASPYDNIIVKILQFLTNKKFNKKPVAIFIDTPNGVLPLRFIPTASGGEFTPVQQAKARPVDWEDFPEFLRQERVRLNVGHIIYFQLREMLDFFNDVIITPIPITNARWKSIGQRGLYFLKNYGESWVTYPPPRIINTFFRFFTRFLGYNYNIWKLSYWYAPSVILNLLVESTGGSGTILCLYRSRTKNGRKKNLTGFTIRIESAAITGIESTDPQFVKSLQENGKNIDLTPEKARDVFYKGQQTYPNLTNVLFISEEFFDQLLRKLLGQFLSLSPLKLVNASRTLSRLRDPRNFYMYPETVGFQYLRKIGGFKLLRWISRLFFDRYEF